MEWKSVGMIIPFPAEWKVIKFHGSKPPTRYIYIYITIDDFPIKTSIYQGLSMAMLNIHQPDINTGGPSVQLDPSTVATETTRPLQWRESLRLDRTAPKAWRYGAKRVSSRQVRRVKHSKYIFSWYRYNIMWYNIMWYIYNVMWYNKSLHILYMVIVDIILYTMI